MDLTASIIIGGVLVRRDSRFRGIVIPGELLLIVNIQSWAAHDFLLEVVLVGAAAEIKF
jgi:hypothetical protein